MKNISDIKAVAIDLDGTTINSAEQLSRYTVDVFRSLLAAGIQVIIATGRSMGSAEKYRSQLNVAGPMVYSNGALVIDMPSKKIICSHELDSDIALYCWECSKKYDAYFQVTFFDVKSIEKEFIITREESEESELYRKRTGFDIRTENMPDELALLRKSNALVKGVFITAPSTIEKIMSDVQERFGERVSPVRSWPTFLEILPSGISKGSGVAVALQHCGLNGRNLIAFGDEENDISMFSIAGYSIATANARESVKAKADFITASNNDDGVAVFLEKLFL